ncbi:MAG: hypothetical protein ASARMPRED_004173 [Alectoria sarmentosa]|nr:MAG: hypothetical protein ASARMPRED_004173 [Alectoria sarmentosa]
MLFYFLLYALYSDTVRAASLPRRSESSGGLAADPTSSLNLFSPANILAPSNDNSTSGNVLKIACDGTLYGKNLKVSSCRNIFHFLSKDETEFRFAQRDSGVPCDVPLPLRTLSTDGLCFVQLLLKKDAVSGRATSTEIGQAAFTLLQTCVIERGMGGMAFNIGGDNQLNVAIANYKPSVKCDSTSAAGPPWKSCVAIFANMRATKQLRIFGYSEDPGVDESLPFVLEAADGKCQARIDIDGPATITSWYEIWEAVTAVANMCTRQKGKGGKAKGLGLGKNIRLELSDKEDSPGDKVGNSSTVSLADAGTAVLDFDDAAPSQAGWMGFDRAVPFELVTGVVQDNESSLVTLPGDPWTNTSATAR